MPEHENNAANKSASRRVEIAREALVNVAEDRYSLLYTILCARADELIAAVSAVRDTEIEQLKKDRDLHESLWRNTSAGIQQILGDDFTTAMEEVYRDGNAGLLQGVAGAVRKIRDRAEAAEALLLARETEHREEKTLGAVSATEGDAVPCSVHAFGASHDARICPQDGSVCWESGCDVKYCDGQREGRDAVIEGIKSHWFIQGGSGEFGDIGGSNEDELIASILERVRALARPARHIPANNKEWQHRMMLAVEGWLHPVSSPTAASPAQKENSTFEPQPTKET